MEECRFRTENGKCSKHIHSIYPCVPTSVASCTAEVTMLDPDEMCQYSSIYGNTYSYVTPEKIELLQKGKVIFIDDGEYGHFIALRKESDV